MKKLLFALAITLTAVATDAGCIKCDQTTGWWCFMSIYGTHAHCDSPTGAGCFMWGACTGGECDDFCVQNIAQVRLTSEMQVASVSITVPLTDSQPRAHRKS